MRQVLVAVALSFLAASGAAHAQLAISPDDSVQSVLSAHKGKRVTLRLTSGQEMTGLVRDTTLKLVVIGTIGGREFFDAVIPLEHVESVLIRTK